MAYGPDTIDMAGRTLTDFRTTGDLGPYRALLEDAVARKVPMLCANPDQRTIDVDGVTPLYMPGTMADAYRAMGGEVVLYGKPGVAHFSAALRAAGVDDAGGRSWSATRCAPRYPRRRRRGAGLALRRRQRRPRAPTWPR